MIECREPLGLALESRQARGIVAEAWRQELERDVAADTEIAARWNADGVITCVHGVNDRNQVAGEAMRFQRREVGWVYR